jgi:serine/threonine-protein kinase RsbW
MPKLVTRPSTAPIGEDGAEAAVVLRVEGFIDAANYLAFEKALEKSFAAGERFLVIDFHDVHYINSTGISVLIRYHELYRKRGGALCLAGVAKEVGLSMHLLGVTSFVPFLKDVPAAQKHLEEWRAGRIDPGAVPCAPGADPSARPAKPGRAVTLRRRQIPGLERARVLVLTPAKGRFTRVLRLRFKTLNGDYHLLHDAREALARYDELAPDLVVLDNRCDPKGEFVSRLKINKERSLTSVVKLYEKETDVEHEIDFKIWENDYLVEPFEILELFSLTEAELARLPKDRKVLRQQVHFELKTTQENIEKAHKLVDVVLRQSISLQEDATALYAAVKEAIDNAAIHGNKHDAAKTIDVNVLVDQKKVTVIVEDQGGGFDFEYYLSRIDDDETFERAKRRIHDENVRGGLGILLMSKCADRLEYSGAGNAVRLEKNL